MKGKKPVILERVFAALAPAQCYGCGRPDVVVCTACWRIADYGVQQCFGCGRASVGGKTCDACHLEASLEGVAVAARYGGGVKAAILALKFQRLRAVAQAAAVRVAKVAPTDIDVVTSVPVAPERYRERGYNQSELLAREVARQLGLPYRTLLRRHSAVHQLGAGRNERLSRVRGQFEPLKEPVGRVLIVDDVVTTGATLNECAQVLRAAGAQAVWGAAVARH